MKTKSAPRNKNLKFLIFQLEKEGKEVEIFTGDRPGRIGAATKNPIERLYFEKILTQEERGVAKNYQYNYEIANLSHHARPSYDGTSASSASAELGEGGPGQDQIDAGRFLFKVKLNLELHNHETIFRGKKFYIVNLKLPEILHQIFEKQFAVRNVRHITGINDREIVKKIKNICKIIGEI